MRRAVFTYRTMPASRTTPASPLSRAMYWSIDPAVGFLESRSQRRARLPMQILLDQGVVAVAAVDAFGRAQIVIALQLDSRDFLDHVHELVDGDRFARTQVDRLQDVGVHDLLNAVGAIVDVHEAARLISAAPDLDFVLAGNLGFDHFAANGRRRLLAAAVPGAPGRRRCESAPRACEAEIFAEVAAHALRKQFFPAVAVFGQRRIGVFFLQRGRFEGLLLVPVVNARGRRIEKALGRRHASAPPAACAY